MEGGGGGEGGGQDYNVQKVTKEDTLSFMSRCMK